MRHPRIGHACIVACVLTVACATLNRPPNLSVEGALSIDGKKVTDGIATAAGLVDIAGTAGDLTPAQAVAVLDPLHTGAVAADALANVLQEVDAAKTDAERAVGIQKAKPYLVAIHKALKDALVPIPAGKATKASERVQMVLGVVLDLMQAFAMPVTDDDGGEALQLAAALPLPLLFQLLPYLIAMYREERERWADAHPGEPVPFPPDEELIALFKGSATHAKELTAGLLAKYRALLPPA